AINDVFIQNPYTGHQELTTLEADVLWEYAKHTLNVKQLATKSKTLRKDPYEILLASFTNSYHKLEKRTGLVILFLLMLNHVQYKASIWGVINEKQSQRIS
ncbi:hypothetical protein CPB85DRAFT_1230632, partial [Mucidula mucida]